MCRFAHAFYPHEHRLLGREGVCDTRSVVTTEKLFIEAEKHYGIRFRSSERIKYVPKSSFVARLDAVDGSSYALKSLFVPSERQRFIAETERLLAGAGVPLAKPVPARNGDLVFMYKGAPFVLYEWEEGRGVSLRRPDDLLPAARCAASLHAASRKLALPQGVQRYDHRDWRTEYEERVRSMRRWAANARGDAALKRIAKRIPFFVEAGELALSMLRRSAYADVRAGRRGEPTLVHGDLHNNNVLRRGGRYVLIDFEDVRYDLPSKDLLRMYGIYAGKHPFVPAALLRMLDEYERCHPLHPDEARLVRIDFLFPHTFERMLRKRKYLGKSEKDLELWLHHEAAKTEFVREHFFAEGTGVKEGYA